jgi:hypothetical protein
MASDRFQFDASATVLSFSHIHLLEHFDCRNNTQQQLMKFPLFVLG